MITIFGIQFGKPFHSTAKIEDQRKQLSVDFVRYNTIKESVTYARYMELSEIVNSGGFEKRVENLKSFKYKNSEPFKKLERLKRLKGSSTLKAYFKPIKNRVDVARLAEISSSDFYKRYFFLKKLVSSNDFKIKSKAKGFIETEDFAILEEFKILKLNVDVIYFNRYGLTKDYQNYLNVKDGSEVKEYNALVNEVATDEFLKLNSELSDKHRFEKSEEYKQINELAALQKDADVLWVNKINPSIKFAFLTNWKLTFTEDFDDVKLDKSKWLTSYYWGQAMLNDSYVTSDDKQIFKDKNVSSKDSILRLSTLHEAGEGKVWDPSKGFYSSTFDYSSGTVNNGHYFRQAYGIFEAKVRFSSVKGLTSAFWLCGESNLPHINVFKTVGKNGNLIEMGKFVKKSGNPFANSKVLSFKNLGSEFHIYTIEWTKDKIVWKINETVVLEQTDNIPSDGLYLNFSSHIKESIDNNHLPALMEIDWVRCYTHQA